MRIKISTTWDEDLLLVRYRVYHRAGIKAVTYMAEITGPHPDYYLSRSFVDRYRQSNPRFDGFTCYVKHDGIYEIVIKRQSEDGSFLSRERMWFVLADGRIYLYEDEDMNYLYVLYCAWLLRLGRAACA